MRMPVLWLALALLAPAAQAGPREFGLEELAQALTARGLTLDIRTELRPGPPELFEVLADRVIGADERGLMYGLLAAAEQIRDSGRLAPERGVPHTAMRGIRRFLHNEAMERDWYYSQEHWDAFFGMLARQRFNRFNLVFAHQTNYLAPPYPFWLDLPSFPEVRVPGLSPADRQRNLAMLCCHCPNGGGPRHRLHAGHLGAQHPARYAAHGRRPDPGKHRPLQLRRAEAGPPDLHGDQ